MEEKKQSELTPQAPSKSVAKRRKIQRFARIPKKKELVRRWVKLGDCCGRGSGSGEGTCRGTRPGCAVCPACITDEKGKAMRVKVRKEYESQGYTVHGFNVSRAAISMSREE